MERLSASTDESTEALKALEKVLASETFRSSPQSIAFLRYVATETLAGRGEELKGYTIATSALGRRDDFDPQVDPIVRVQANRVRKALADYAAGEGASDVLRLALDKGSYKVRFESRTPDARPDAAAADSERAQSALDRSTPPNQPSPTVSPALAPSAPSPTGLSPRALAAALSLLAIIGLAVVWFPVSRPVSEASRSFPKGEERPAIVVIVRANSDIDTPARQRAERFKTSVENALARFDDLIVVREARPGIVQASPHAYELRLSPAPEASSLILDARLVYMRSGEIVWNMEWPRGQPGQPGMDEESLMVRTLVTLLGRPYGILTSDLQKRLGFEATNGSHACVLIAFEYWRISSRAAHGSARDCLLEMVRSGRAGTGHFAQLAYLHLEEYRHGYNPMAGDPVERAQDAAERAVRLGPDSARARQALMATRFSRRQFDEAFEAGTEAMRLNPFDMDILADVGARRIQRGDIATGLPLILEALKALPAPPIWIRVYASLGHYALDQYDQAAMMADRIAESELPMAILARVLASNHLQDKARLRAALATLDRVHPQISGDVGSYLDRLVIAPALSERIVESLRLARLAVAE
jgi:hypothetical protein